MARARAPQAPPDVTEAEIAVHWKEEEYYRPPAKFVGQANLTDPAVMERFSLERFPECFRAYADLSRTHAYFASVNVLDYDAEAARHDADLRTTLRRMGTKDRRIAAIARSRGCILVTRNVVDFRDVPGLTLEDWMAP